MPPDSDTTKRFVAELLALEFASDVRVELRKHLGL